jgi:hypothetical protein
MGCPTHQVGTSACAAADRTSPQTNDGRLRAAGDVVPDTCNDAIVGK